MEEASRAELPHQVLSQSARRERLDRSEASRQSPTRKARLQHAAAHRALGCAGLATSARAPFA
eukprot:6199730-Pleurochrysis_carterae.AAC.2